VVSNAPFDIDARSKDFPTLWDMSRQRADLVAVILPNRPDFTPCQADADAALRYTAAEGGDPSHWNDEFSWPDVGSLYGYDASLDRQLLAAYLWLGREASEEDMSLGVAAVTTIDPIDGWHVECHQRWKEGWFPRPERD